MAVNIRKFVLQAHSLDELVALGTLTAAGGPLPRGRGRRRAEHPRLRRHPGRQDDAAELPVRRDPGPRAGGHLRGGLRAARAAARRRLDADPPAQPGGRRRDPAAPAWSRRRCGCGPRRIVVGEVRAGGVPRPADRAELRAAGHVHAARQQRPRGRGEDVHAAAAGRARTSGRRSSSPPSPSSVDLVVHVGTDAAGSPAGARDRRAARPGRGRRRRDRRHLHHAATGGWSAPTATRRTPTGSPRAGFDLPALLGGRSVDR